MEIHFVLMPFRFISEDVMKFCLKLKCCGFLLISIFVVFIEKQGIIFIKKTLLLPMGYAPEKRQKPKTQDFGSPPTSHTVFLVIHSLQHVYEFIWCEVF